MVCGSLTSSTCCTCVEDSRSYLAILLDIPYCRAAKVMRKRADIDISVGVSVDSAQRTLFPDRACGMGLSIILIFADAA